MEEGPWSSSYGPFSSFPISATVGWQIEFGGFLMDFPGRDGVQLLSVSRETVWLCVENTGELVQLPPCLQPLFFFTAARTLLSSVDSLNNDRSACEEARNKNNGKAPHSAWQNYDDFNEYFWSLGCFELNWPWRKNSSFFSRTQGKSKVVVFLIKSIFSYLQIRTH